MRRMLVIVAALAAWLPTHGYALAQDGAVAPNSTAALQQRLEHAEERSRSDRLDLAVRIAADKLEDAQTEQAYNRFAIWMGATVGFFSVLITLLVVAFGFRTSRAAATEAATAAQREISGAKSDIEALANAAEKATNAARAAAETADELLEQARTNIQHWEQVAKIASESAQASAQEASAAADMVQKGVQAIAQAAERAQLGTAEAGEPKVTLTEEEAAAVEAGAEAIRAAPESEWSVDDYKVRIGKAAYIDEDAAETLRLATLLEVHHGDKEEALSFALLRQGDALRAQRRYDRAIGVYSDLIDRLATNENKEIVTDVLWARYFKGVILALLSRREEAEQEFTLVAESADCLGGPAAVIALASRHELACSLMNRGRAAEAEREFRELLAADDGSADDFIMSSTLRYSLARALLMQGRAVEAAAEFVALIPGFEAAHGVEGAGTLTVRYSLARALLLQGKAAEAVAILREVLAAEERRHGTDHSVTMVTRYTLADALLENGEVEEAARLLAEIPEHPQAPDWAPRWAAALAFVRAKVCDAMGDSRASQWLEQSLALFEALYPSGNFERQRVEDYAHARSKHQG